MPPQNNARRAFLSRHLHQHGRFYAGMLAAAVSFAIPFTDRLAVKIAAAGDAFFGAYLVLLVIEASYASATSTMKRARADDDGLLIVAALTIAAVIVSLTAIVALLTSKDRPNGLHAVLTIICVPLGWLTMHASFATHYTREYYKDGGGGRSREGLEFPGDDEPDLWDFLYFSYVLGMTAQTSDVDISGRAIRRLVLIHSIIAYFYNAVIIALAVNVAVQSAGS